MLIESHWSKRNFIKISLTQNCNSLCAMKPSSHSKPRLASAKKSFNDFGMQNSASMFRDRNRFWSKSLFRSQWAATKLQNTSCNPVGLSYSSKVKALCFPELIPFIRVENSLLISTLTAMNLQGQLCCPCALNSCPLFAYGAVRISTGRQDDLGSTQHQVERTLCNFSASFQDGLYLFTLLLRYSNTRRKGKPSFQVPVS